jgi:hypothetical protein
VPTAHVTGNDKNKATYNKHNDCEMQQQDEIREHLVRWMGKHIMDLKLHASGRQNHSLYR